MRAVGAILCSLLLLAGAPSLAEASGRGLVSVKMRDGGSEKDVPLYGRSYALVIGIDRYTDPAWPSLSNAINDAKAVANALEAQGFEVTLKNDLKSAALRQAIEDFVYEKGRFTDARLLIWYAGHGHTIDSEGYLAPADAPTADKDDWKFRRAALSLREFGRYMREAKAKHVLAVFDSCFSGTVFNTARAKPPAVIERVTAENVRQYVSSGEASQTVSDDGLFRKLFLDAITGRDPRADMNGDGYVIGSELGLYLEQQVSEKTENRQTPRHGKLAAYGYDLGDFVFKAGAAVAPAPVATPAAAAPADNAELAALKAKMAALEAALQKQKEAAPATSGGQPGANSPGWGSTVKNWLGGSGEAPAPAQPDEPKVAIGVYPEGGATVSPSPLGGEGGGEGALKPGDTFDDCNGAGWCPKLVVVPAGSFTMGSPAGEEGRSDDEDDTPGIGGKQVKVTIARPFAVGRFEVTWDEWDACVKGGGCDNGKVKEAGGDEGWGKGKRPVINVSWDDAKAYVKWLAKKTGESYRLLSEAEWEYAARAGSKTPFWWGASISTAQANYDGNHTYGGGKKGEYRQKTVAVDSFKPNAFGLYNVHGNVWEWVEDCYQDSYKGAPTDGSAKTTKGCGTRVLRGGSWDDSPQNLRSALRDRVGPDVRGNYSGFRVARVLSLPGLP